MHSTKTSHKNVPQFVPHVLLVGRKTAALMIEVSVRTIDYLVQQKILKTKRVGRRVLIEVASLRRLARNGHLGPLSKR